MCICFAEMAMGKAVVCVLLLLALLVEGNEGATCNTIQLAPCLSAVKKGADNVTPSAGCCNNIKKFTPSCLCASLQSNLAKQYNVDVATALTVPKRCSVKFDVPPNYTCAGYKVPQQQLGV